MQYAHLLNTLRSSFVAAFIIAALLIVSFIMVEPQVGRGATSTFTVSQQITNEISFLVSASNVTMVGSIQGLTGGYATGTTYAVVRSNSPTGYNMTIGFSSTTAMSASSSAYINNYTPAATTAPDFAWADNTSGQAAEFGFTVRASTTGEVDASFLNNGSACNTGTNETDDRCWQNPTTSPAAETIINSNAPSVSSTTTVKFKVAVPSNPSPALPAAFYVATATLTATNNP
jgi:hypothetical protein